MVVLIGGLVLQRRPYPSNTTAWNDDSHNSSYTLTDAPVPFLVTTTPPDSPYIKLVHEAGDASAVWSVGNNAFCKVRYIEEGVTPKSVTLNFVRDQRPSFETPKVIYQAFGNDRSYLFLQRVQRHYVNAVVNVYKEMAEWRGHRPGGVDGQNIPDYYLVTPQGSNKFSSVNLEAACKAMGMVCSNVVFFHADLGPTNIIVQDKPSLARVGIIDFEISGYFPKGWIRTKFRLSSGIDLFASATDNQTW